jgi:hypothetical protein
MEKQIYDYLKKYYLHFNEKKFKALLLCKTDDETFSMFQTLWKKEHGGLYRIDTFSETFHASEVLPYMQDNKIVVTETGSNSKKFHQAYIKKLNHLLLANTDGVLHLDFTNNHGGKPQVMMAGLLPIFNNFDLTVLSYYYDRDGKKHQDVKRTTDNTIMAISNNKATSIGTKRKCKVDEINIYYSEMTASAGEQAIICLSSLAKYVKVNIFTNGDFSQGYTTVVKYIKLSAKYGIEIPIGYMGTSTKVYYKGLQG